MERALGRSDLAFLEKAFQGLLLNFNWWVNRKDPEGKNVFAGGFLGLDNIGVFDRSRPLPTGGHLDPSAQANVAPEDIVNETFFLPSRSAPAVRRVVLEYFNRAGIDIRPEHEVHNVVHAISMITSTHAVMLLPAYTARYLPDTITTRPVQGEAPTLDLVIAYHKANKSPILKLLLSRVGRLAGAAA